MQYRDQTLYVEDVALADIAHREGTPCYTRGEDYGRGHLSRALRRLCGHDPETVASEILADLDEYSAGVPMADDQTLVVLKVH